MFQRGIAVALLLCAAAFPLLTANRGAETPSAPAVAPRDDERGMKRDFEFRVEEAYFQDKEATAAATTPVFDSVGAFLRAVWSVLTHPADDGADVPAKAAMKGAGAAVVGPLVRSVGDLLGSVHAVLMIPIRPGPALPPAPDGPPEFQSIPPGYYFGPGKP